MKNILSNPPALFSLAWQDIYAPTLKAFIGLCFVMGILRLPGKTDYWRKSKRMFKTAFNDIMTKDRFNIIWRYLHLNDQQVPLAVPDELIKVRWCGFFFSISVKIYYNNQKN